MTHPADPTLPLSPRHTFFQRFRDRSRPRFPWRRRCPAWGVGSLQRKGTVKHDADHMFFNKNDGHGFFAPQELDLVPERIGPMRFQGPKSACIVSIWSCMQKKYCIDKPRPNSPDLCCQSHPNPGPTAQICVLSKAAAGQCSCVDPVKEVFRPVWLHKRQLKMSGL